MFTFCDDSFPFLYDYRGVPVARLVRRCSFSPQTERLERVRIFPGTRTSLNRSVTEGQSVRPRAKHHDPKKNDFCMTIVQRNILACRPSSCFNNLLSWIYIYIYTCSSYWPSTIQKATTQDLSRCPTTLQWLSYAICWRNIWMPAVSLCNDGGKDSWWRY